MMPKEKLRKADVLAAVGFIALGGVVIAGALQMPMGGTYGGVRNPWWASPAMFPLMIGTLLILCSLIVLGRALAEGGHRGLIGFFGQRLRGLPRNVEVHRLVLAAALMGFYVFALFGRIDFYIASSLFLIAFMACFYRPGGGIFAPRRWLVILAVGALMPVVTGYLFRTYLLVPLP